MHAECRYICNHHPCLPVKMLRNYKERSPRQTKEKKTTLAVEGKATIIQHFLK